MSQLFEQGGPILLAILGLSLLAWTLIVKKWWELRLESERDQSWVEAALAHVGAGRHGAARQLCGQHHGLSARLLAVGLDVRSRGAPAFRRRMEPVLDAEVFGLHRGLDMVAAVGTVAPLLGLLGTVSGMVNTFGVLTRESTVELNELTEGISQALVTTQAGLLIALPILLVHRLLRSKLDRQAQSAQAMLQALERAVHQPAAARA